MKMCTQHFQYANLFPFGCRCRWWWWCDMPIWKGHLNTLSSLFSLSFFLSFSRSSDCSKSSRKKITNTHMFCSVFFVYFRRVHTLFSCSPVALSLCFIHSKMCVRFFCFRNKIVSCWWAICMHWLCFACVQARMHVWIEIISFTEKKNHLTLALNIVENTHTHFTHSHTYHHYFGFAFFRSNNKTTTDSKYIHRSKILVTTARILHTFGIRWSIQAISCF